MAGRKKSLGLSQDMLRRANALQLKDQRNVCCGTIPQGGELLAELGSWQLWVKSKTHLQWFLDGESEWCPLKLIATAPRLGRANFELSFSVERFARGKDFAFVCDNLPELLPWFDAQRLALAGQVRPQPPQPECETGMTVSVERTLRHDHDPA